MTNRQKRIHRFTSLRELEHARAIEKLRAAQHALEIVERDISKHAHALAVYGHEQEVALGEGRHDLWLLSRPESAICELESLHAVESRRLRELEVRDATTHESNARLAFRQLEHIMLHIRKEERSMQSRKEQQYLDEVGRLLQQRAKKS